MKTVRAVLILAICMLAAGLRTRADAFSFALDPANGAVEGPAGSTVGWGFTLTSTSADFAVITGSDFCVGAVSSPCSNTLGTYTDFTGSQFIVVGPAAGENTVSETFDNTAMNGVGSFSISPADIPAESVVGEIALFYDLFSVDRTHPILTLPLTPSAPDTPPPTLLRLRSARPRGAGARARRSQERFGSFSRLCWRDRSWGEIVELSFQLIDGGV